MTISHGERYSLRPLTDEQGVWCITAMDERKSPCAILSPGDDSAVWYEDVVDATIEPAAALTPSASRPKAQIASAHSPS